ncbi:hypothetical protein EDD18DRAFT_1357406 [Armillaria luteobubalina]|uniref:ribonuclease Z n=1 Tax=Armillaria luteobubalina TaxID=153913 RepID=A0AA39Q0F7_9AGAR|nr:hypothetical protein EDD18DRAFT_1357406 [Armillaria luteobubalina]
MASLKREEAIKTSSTTSSFKLRKWLTVFFQQDPATYTDSGRWILRGREPWTDIDESRRHAKDLCAALDLKSFRTIDVRHRMTPRYYGLNIKSLDDWSIVFSDDTTPAGALVYAGQGATLVIHEATMADDQEELASEKAHSTHKSSCRYWHDFECAR